MMPLDIAAIGVARLGLPMPMAKLVTIQAIGRALMQEATAEIFIHALENWIETRELESECLEALCPLLVATHQPDVIARLRRAIARPSLASDLILSRATGNPVFLASWTSCHSGPAPQMQSWEKEEQSLRGGTFIPRIFTNKLEALQRRSGFPFLRQWSFEYSLLSERCKNASDGHLDFFLGSERGMGGQFVARKGHLGRSAYLRTLAFAVDRWDLPIDVANRFAEAAFPAEPIFLRLPPQRVPSWAPFVHAQLAGKTADAAALACSVIRYLEEEQARRLMHCSMTVVDEPLSRTDIEIFVIARTQSWCDPEVAVAYYHHLVGKATPSRDDQRAFVSPEIKSGGWGTMGFVPIILPLIGPSVGYLQFDLLSRLPFMPVSTKNVPNMELLLRDHDAVMQVGDLEVGSWGWWLWNWKPGHPQGWSSPVACCASLSPVVAQQIADDVRGRIEHVWKITNWKRDDEYGEWQATEHFGITKSAAVWD